MNDIEKAIQALKMNNDLIEFDSITGEDVPIEWQNQDNQDLYKANLLAISVLEKQLSKRPFADDNGSIEYYEAWLECPVCNEIIPEYTEENETECYCLKCGQKLDWS